MIAHRQLEAYVDHLSSALSITNADRIAMLSAASFDPSIGDIFCAALHGGTLVTAPKSLITGRLACVLRAANPDVVVSTPALWATIREDEACTVLRGTARVALGGEATPVALTRLWAPHVRLYSIYGVTECVGYQALQRLLPAATETWADFGRPLGRGLRFFLRSLPPGDSAGDDDGGASLFELVLSGSQTGQGYLAAESRGAVQPFPRIKSLLHADAYVMFEACPVACAADAENGDSHYTLHRIKAEDAVEDIAVFPCGDLMQVIGDLGGSVRLRLRGRRDFQAKLSGDRKSVV